MHVQTEIACNHVSYRLYYVKDVCVCVCSPLAALCQTIHKHTATIQFKALAERERYDTSHKMLCSIRQ